MQNPLDVTGASANASFISAFRSSAVKPDSSDENPFAGVLNQALQASSQDTHTSKAAHPSGSGTGATPHKTDDPEPTNQPKADSNNPITKSKDPAAAKQTHTTEQASDAKSGNKTNATSENDAANPTQAKTAADANTASTEQPSDEDKPKTETPDISLTIGAVPTDSQPLNLALLQATAPLLAQPLSTPLATTPTAPGEAQPDTGASTPIDPTAGAAASGIVLPTTASSIALNPTGSLFEVSALKDTATVPATTTATTSQNGQTPTGETSKVGPQQTLLAGLAATAEANSTPETTSPATADPTTSASALTLSGAMANAAQPDQSSAKKTKTEPNATAEPIATEAIGALSVLNAPVGNTTPAERKPNATLPQTDTFKQSLNSIQASMNAMQGDIESAPDHKQDGLPDSALTAAPQSDASGINASDLLSAGGLNGTGSGSVSGSNGDGSINGIPTFNATAQNPTLQIAEGTAYSVKNGHKELIIRLNPDNLGEVKINLTTNSNQQLSARLIASTTESHDLLKGQLDSLKTTLAAQGVSVDRLSVVLAGSAESGGSKDASKQEQTFSQEQSQNQQNTAQGSFQQQFNQQNPTSANLFGQMNGQSQSGFSQNQTASHLTDGTDTGAIGASENTTSNSASNGHDNGRISILA